MFDGKVPHWHHFSCFWQRAAAQSTADIAGFSDLRWEDQEKVKKAIETGGATGGTHSRDDDFWWELLYIMVINKMCSNNVINTFK